MKGVSGIRRNVDIASKYVDECGKNSEIKRVREGADYFAFNRPYDSSADKLRGIFHSTLRSLLRPLSSYRYPRRKVNERFSISGALLCRLTPPLCLNFLSLVHMDSHVNTDASSETQYTRVMGHMDVVSIVQVNQS